MLSPVNNGLGRIFKITVVPLIEMLFNVYLGKGGKQPRNKGQDLQCRKRDRTYDLPSTKQKCKSLDTAYVENPMRKSLNVSSKCDVFFQVLLSESLL
jgi:hypothetical protein